MNDEQLVDRVKGAGGIILGVSENRNWIELPSGTLFDIFIEEIPHKSTIYEYPRTLIYLDGPCDVEICREGRKIIVRGCQSEEG